MLTSVHNKAMQNNARKRTLRKLNCFTSFGKQNTLIVCDTKCRSRIHQFPILIDFFCVTRLLFQQVTLLGNGKNCNYFCINLIVY